MRYRLLHAFCCVFALPLAYLLSIFDQLFPPDPNDGYWHQNF